mmetsp:Transcript_11075/g.17721  ORF Transcript_11075/g.17721 Transcript_11075/m.17721 type:complete len:203 (-) Transcript_11075:224-832(-)
MAEVATIVFKVTHKLQGIPFQNEIIDGKLWLGQLGAARNFEWISSKQITHICSVTQWGKAAKFHEGKGRFVYHVIKIEDTPQSRILDHLDEAADFIHGALAQNHRVLVHCNQGRSRSATVLTAYFIKYKGTQKQVDEHIRGIKERRPEVCPNAGFMRQLEKYRARCIVTAEVSSQLHRSRAGKHTSGLRSKQVAKLVAQYCL